MIKNIKLKFGRAEGLPQETVEAMPITVFVGPNNSGKSMILSEIQQFCSDGSRNVNNLIVDSIELEAIPEKLIKEKIKSVTLKPNPGEDSEAAKLCFVRVHVFVRHFILLVKACPLYPAPIKRGTLRC
jgi:AAA15 family ATPase/GTPase